MEVKRIYESMEYGPAPESSSAAIEWLEKHNRTFQLYINGKWQSPKSAKYFDSVNPANKEFLAKISVANKEDVDKAVKAARTALPEWIKA